jgi:WD40 repeat protein
MRITVIAGVLVAAAWLAGARAEDGVDVLASGVRGVSIAASGDGARLVVLGAEGTVRVLASADGTEIASLPGAKARRAWFVGPDGSLVATAGEDVAVWSVPKQKVLRRIAPSVMSAADRAGRYDDGCGWFAAAASPRDKTIATLGFDGRVALWSMATDRDAGSIQSDGQGKAAAFSFDGTKLAAVVQRAGEARSLVVFDLSRRAVSWRPPIADKSDPGIELWRWSEATFSGDGKTLYAACMQPRFGGAAGEDGLVRAFDLTRSKPLWTRRFEDDAVLRTACSAKGGRIAVATRRGVALLDPATGATTAILGGAADAPSDIAFSPDGSVLYCVLSRRQVPVDARGRSGPDLRRRERDAPPRVHDAGRRSELRRLPRRGRGPPVAPRSRRFAGLRRARRHGRADRRDRRAPGPETGRPAGVHVVVRRGGPATAAGRGRL